jgi:hypothetical protein
MSESGLIRAQEFLWSKAARDTLGVFEELVKNQINSETIFAEFYNIK